MNDFLPMLLEFSQNLTLLIALTFFYSLVIRKISTISETSASLLQGVLFGVVAIIGMQIPMHVSEGIIVDGRTVIVMLASPFAGTMAGLVAGAMVALFRLYLGGIGTLAGIGAIISAMIIGMVFSRSLALKPGTIKVRHLLTMSVIMTVISLLWIFALPASIDAVAILKRLLVPVGVMYPLTALLLGFLLAHEYRSLELIQTVKDSERRFKGLFDNAGVSIWNEDLSAIHDTLESLRTQGVTDLRSYLAENDRFTKNLAAQVKVIAVNKATLKLFDATSSEDMLTRIDTTFGPGALSVFIDQLCALWEGQKVFRSEASFRSLKGRDLTAIIAYEIPTSAEGFKSIPVSIIDITERRQLEEKIRRSQKMEAVGQLTGGISHDFNNLLGIIQGNLELLSEMLPGNEKALNRIETAQKSVTRGAEITKKLLGFSRKAAEQQQTTFVNNFIEHLQDLIAKSLTATVKVETRLAEDLWPVRVDTGDLENAILNLALNARDAMPEGGTLIIETMNKTLDDTYVTHHLKSKVGDYVVISVSDNGIGMTDEIQEKVLEPFFTTKGVGKGTGLGLSMVYGFVERSGGHLDIYSEVGRGTIIRVYLPSAQAPEKNLTLDPDSAPPLPGGAETILIVDDEDALLDVASNYLGKLGYTTLTAENGKQALEVLGTTDKVDLLFSDVVMTGELDGYQLAAAASKHRPSLKILLTSGFSRGHATVATTAGEELKPFTNRMLEKPYNMSELAVALRDTLDRAS